MMRWTRSASGSSSTKVNYIVDADVRSFFDTVSQDWLIRFLEHRIGDPRMIRLIRKWLKAGVMEDGIVERRVTGAPRKAQWSPRCSPTSTCTTPSTCGPSGGDGARPRATS